MIMARELWREERVLLLDVNQGSVGFYVLSGRHCLACRMTGLKAGCFLREGKSGVLATITVCENAATASDSAMLESAKALMKILDGYPSFAALAAHPKRITD